MIARRHGAALAAGAVVLLPVLAPVTPAAAAPAQCGDAIDGGADRDWANAGRGADTCVRVEQPRQCESAG